MVGITIATPDTATLVVKSIFKTGIPPKRALLTGEEGHGWAGADFTVTKKHS